MKFYSFLLISNSNHKKYDNLHKKYNIEYIYLNTKHLFNNYNYYLIQIYNFKLLLDLMVQNNHFRKPFFLSNFHINLIMQHLII